jgi:hypothetical protein
MILRTLALIQVAASLGVGVILLAVLIRNRHLWRALGCATFVLGSLVNVESVALGLHDDSWRLIASFVFWLGVDVSLFGILITELSSRQKGRLT